MVTILNWAILDITFTPVSDGVKCIVVTDSPCHLFLRYSLVPPRKHPLSRTFRGLKIMAGTRFCFVAWTENEQEEAGDTLTHTFLKPNWGYCQTRWFYFRGTKEGEDSPSASCLFEYHSAFHPPEQMFYPFEPTKCVILFDDTWFKVTDTLTGSLKDLLPSNAEVAFLHIVNRGSAQDFGLRPINSTHSQTGALTGASHQWAHVKLDSDNNFEAYLDNRLTIDVFLMGFATISAVTMFNDPITINCNPPYVWSTLDLSGICPNAVGILCETPDEDDGLFYGIRKLSSTDNRIDQMNRTWPVVGCDANQKIEELTLGHDEVPCPLYITGYIKENALFNTNGIGVTPDILGSYVILDLSPIPHLAFIEVHGGPPGKKYALRPLGSAEDIYYQKNQAHCFAVSSLDLFGQFEGKLESEGQTYHHLGSGT